MRIVFDQPTLAALDRQPGGCLVLTTFEEDRPLRGLSGRVDWRLNGRLSRLLLDGFVDSHFLEASLSPLAGKLPFDRLLLIGLGKRSEFTPQRFDEACRFCFETLAGLTARRIVLAPQGQLSVHMTLQRLADGWRSALLDCFDAESIALMEICILVDGDTQRELAHPMLTLERELKELAHQELNSQAPAPVMPAPSSHAESHYEVAAPAGFSPPPLDLAPPQSWLGLRPVSSSAPVDTVVDGKLRKPT